MCFYGIFYESSRDCVCRSGAVFAYAMRRRVQIGIHTIQQHFRLFIPSFQFVRRTTFCALFARIFFVFFFHFGCFILYNFSLILSGYMIVCLCVCVYKSEHTVHCSCVERLICCSNKSKYESSILYTITNISECQILFAT